MPRKRTRTTDRGVPLIILKEALRLVQEESYTIRKAAALLSELHETKICPMTLSRYISAKKRGESPTPGYKSHKKVFSDELETRLARYLQDAADACFGKTPREVRKIAYDYAVGNKCKMPPSWHENELAGEEWFTAFLKRQVTLSLRSPEATSLARAMGFNKPVCTAFFKLLLETIVKHKIDAANIWNIDETGLNTVADLLKIVATKGMKQVSGLTSHERGTLITMCIAICASGRFIPPMFLFPRSKFKPHFINGAPLGSIGAANGSGWMEAPEFLQFLEHFINHVKPSIERKHLILMDNHSSHIQLESVELCRKNGIVLLTFPPHTSHKLQPLDRTVYGPFKNYYKEFSKKWLEKNPGKRMSIYDISAVAASAFPAAFTSSNIINGFKAAGIQPYNPDVFKDSDYKAAATTDLEMVETKNTTNDTNGTPPVEAPSTEKANVLPDATSSVSGSSMTHAATLTRPAQSKRTVDDVNLARPGPSTVIVSVPDLTLTRPSTSSASNVHGVNLVQEKANINYTVTSPNTPVCNGKYQVLTTPQSSSSSSLVLVSPDEVCPLPKAQRQSKKETNRVQVVSAVLTDTPEKNKLIAVIAEKKAKEEAKAEAKKRRLEAAAERMRKKEEAEAKKMKKHNSQEDKVQKKRAPKKPVSRVLFTPAVENDNRTSNKKKAKADDDCFCLICGEPFENSRPKEKWVACNSCQNWSHEECTTGVVPYMCHECVPE